MTQANDSITVTPGSGASVATHLIAGKEHQAVVQVNEAGHIMGSTDAWSVFTGNTAHVAAARTTLIDLFNAAGSGVTLKVRGIFIIPALAAVTGVGMTYEVIRTSAVGTGGTAATPVAHDTTNVALPAGVTARTKPTAGATTSATLALVNGSSEETSPYAGMASQLNHVPCGSAFLPMQHGYVIREGQGLKIDQTTNSAVGNVNVMLVFSVE